MLATLNVAVAQSLQRIEVPSSMNPVGSGARAMGMGGAFIAVADDATAASWNPGGLIQLEKPEFSVVGTYVRRMEDNTFGTHPEANGQESVDGINLNYLSAVYPFDALRRNMVVSVNYQRLFDLSRHWAFPLSFVEPDLTLDQAVTIDQDGSLSAIGVAYGIQLTPWIALGITLNIWSDDLTDNHWKMESQQSGSGVFMGNQITTHSRVEDRFSFSGLNANFGFKWDINHRLTIGAVLKTPFTADLVHDQTVETSLRFANVPESDSVVSLSKTTDEQLDMPVSYGCGLAYRFSDRLTTSLDVYRTEWDDYVLTDSNGNRISPITGGPAGEADVTATIQVRTGMEYLYIADTYVVPLRAGIFYDPAPAVNDPDDIYGCTLGTGIAVGKYIFDIAYQYRFGNDVSTFLLTDLDYSQDLQEHMVYGSFIYHF